MIPPVVSALLWKWFYDPGAGLANEALRLPHLPTSNWSNGTDTALVSLVIVATWANMGGTVLIYLAALQSIPGELYEAAELDGANLLQRVRHVTIPQTRFVIPMLMLLQIIATMQVFTGTVRHHRAAARRTPPSPSCTSSTNTPSSTTTSAAPAPSACCSCCCSAPSPPPTCGSPAPRGRMSGTRTLISPAALARPRGKALY